MKEYGVKVNYLYNSGFFLETKNYILVFDYFLDMSAASIKSVSNGTIGKEDLKKGKEVLVFSSHSHADHFNPVILNWEEINPDIKYIFSNDIELSDRDKNIHFMAPYETISIGDVDIATYGSTDLGVSFLVKVEGMAIFHAGDLNWWHWWDEDDNYNKNAEKSYKLEIEKLKEETLDIAFFPVDPRLKESYLLGGEYFIENMNPHVFIPMHFGENYDIIKQFIKHIGRQNKTVRIIDIEHRGQEFSI